MISSKPKPLSEEQAKILREWLDDPGFKLVIRVAEAHQKSAEAQALTKAADHHEHPLQLEVANEHLREAHHFAVFVKILNQIAQQKTFNEVTLE